MDPKFTGAKPPRHGVSHRAKALSGGSASQALRHVRLETGHTLRTWDTGASRGTGMMARTRIGYELRSPAGAVLFCGDDFAAGAAIAIDSDDALRGLCGFLFLRPGDTDREYFDGYTLEQLAFAVSSECEQLAYLYSEDGPGVFAEVVDSADAGEGV